MDCYCELIDKTPYLDEIEEIFVPEKERFRDANYWIDLEIQRLKRSL